MGPGRLRSSRGRTRTCDPLTPNGHDRVLGRRKIRDWRAENPEETSETHPKRTCPTVPNRTARNEARRVNSTAPRQTAYNFHSPLTGGSLHRAGCIGNMTLERRQGVGLLYIVCLMTPRTPQADLKLSRCSVRQDARAHPHDTRRLAGREVLLRLRVIKLMVRRHGLEAIARLIAAQRLAKPVQVRRVAVDQQLSDSLSVGERTGREYAT